MQIDKEKYEKLYQRFQTLPTKTDRITAYGSDVSEDIDDDVIMDFYEALCEDFEEGDITDWSEAYVQLFSWQFQSYHEGVDTYYKNFYGHTSKENIIRAVAGLNEIGCTEVAKAMEAGLKAESLESTSQWIDEHAEEIYIAYLAIVDYSRRIIGLY